VKSPEDFLSRDERQSDTLGVTPDEHAPTPALEPEKQK
jgi:hypothetical protein